MTWLARAVVLLCIIGCRQSRTATEWHDPSPHTIRMVRVESSTSLEVLDWGGHGESIVLLAGLGNTAHVFDRFAPLLSDSFHVFGVTRRGFGASSQPPSGETAQLVSDLAAVFDTLGLQRVILIGHSIAGEELSAFGVKYPDRTAALVYLDAAYDRSGFAKTLQRTPLPSPPPMQAVDSLSPAAVTAYVRRTFGIAVPESEVRAGARFDSTGRYRGDVTPDSLAGVMLGRLQPPDYAHLRSPALAIYAVSDSMQLLIPFYAALDSTGRREVQQYATVIAPLRSASEEGFRRATPSAEVLEIRDANHYVFISNEAETLHAIRSFLSRRDRNGSS